MPSIIIDWLIPLLIVGGIAAAVAWERVSGPPAPSR
jgi:hypothetical protein